MSHRTELRPRQIMDTYCTEDGCEFNGEHAVQGHCYSREPDVLDLDRLSRHEGELERELVEVRERYSQDPDGYISWLESMYMCSQLNWDSALDQCIHLRAENARLRRAKG